jgi:hypothetical protein
MLRSRSEVWRSPSLARRFSSFAIRACSASARLSLAISRASSAAARLPLAISRASSASARLSLATSRASSATLRWCSARSRVCSEWSRSISLDGSKSLRTSWSIAQGKSKCLREVLNIGVVLRLQAWSRRGDATRTKLVEFFQVLDWQVPERSNCYAHRTRRSGVSRARPPVRLLRSVRSWVWYLFEARDSGQL